MSKPKTKREQVAHHKLQIKHAALHRGYCERRGMAKEADHYRDLEEMHEQKIRELNAPKTNAAAKAKKPAKGTK